MKIFERSFVWFQLSNHSSHLTEYSFWWIHIKNRYWSVILKKGRGVIDVTCQKSIRNAIWNHKIALSFRHLPTPEQCSHSHITGVDPGFFLEGGAPLTNDVTDGELKKFKSEYVYMKKKTLFQGVGAYPLHPPPRSAPASCSQWTPHAYMFCVLPMDFQGKERQRGQRGMIGEVTGRRRLNI